MYRQRLADGTTRLTGGVAGGEPGPAGPVGPQGTRWGTTNAFLFGSTLEDASVDFPPGQDPRVGDLVVTTNGFGPGMVYRITAVTSDVLVDLEQSHEPPLSIRGPQGAAGNNLSAWPIDSVYISFSPNNPSLVLGGGTWTAVGSGRMLIGVDPGDPTMDFAGDTGGAKTHTLTEAEMPSHTHTQNAHNHTQDPHTHTQQTNTSASAGGSYARSTGTAGGALASGSTTATNNAATAVNQNTGGGLPHNNLPPYLAVYMWRRTA